MAHDPKTSPEPAADAQCCQSNAGTGPWDLSLTVAVFPPAMVVLQDGYHLSYGQICATDHMQTLHAVDSPEFCVLTFPWLLLLHIVPISPK